MALNWFRRLRRSLEYSCQMKMLGIFDGVNTEKTLEEISQDPWQGSDGCLVRLVILLYLCAENTTWMGLCGGAEPRIFPLCYYFPPTNQAGSFCRKRNEPASRPLRKGSHVSAVFAKPVVVRLDVR
jgi:hypothetical protein